MNKPTISATEPDVFPKGKLITWDGEGEFAGVSLNYQHSPTVQVVDDPAEAVTFEGSLDGVSWGVCRDKEGDVVRITKAGVYRLPVAVPYLRPVSRGTVCVKVFIQR